jgi:S1-C subfamily serine protease
VDGPIDGLVGYSFFARFRTTLDYARGQVSFTPVPYQPKDVVSNVMSRMLSPDTPRTVLTPAALWGMAVEKNDTAEGVVVKRVYPKSAAAAAGLRPGDRILTLDGRWTDSLPDVWEAAAGVLPGTEAVLRIGRDGAEREVRVKPRRGL